MTKFISRKGSLIVDYDVYTKSVSSAAANIVSVNQNLVSGKTNVTYDGKAAPVSSMAFKDKSGKTGISSFTNGPDSVPIIIFVFSIS